VSEKLSEKHYVDRLLDKANGAKKPTLKLGFGKSWRK